MDEEEEKVLTVEGKETSRWRRIGGREAMVWLCIYSTLISGLGDAAAILGGNVDVLYVTVWYGHERYRMQPNCSCR